MSKSEEILREVADLTKGNFKYGRENRSISVDKALAAMKEIAELSWAEGFKESTTWFGGETLPECQLDGGKNYHEAKQKHINQLFNDTHHE